VSNRQIEPSPSVTSDADRWYHLQRSVEERTIQVAFDLFRSQGVEPILIKGWAAARNYPSETTRSSTDIDLAFESGSYDKAYRIARDNEFRFLILDIHREFKHLDTVPWQTVFERSQLVKLGNADVRIPSAEDHLRLLCVHWLVDGGWFRERLWDIYYAVERRPNKFDWSICLDEVAENRRRWVIYAIGLAHHYLGLNVDDLPFADTAKKLPAWLIRAVEREWASGLRLMPINQFLREPVMFLKQMRKRLPLNPITATIDVEGSFDSSFRIHYQIGSMLKRLPPSFRTFRSYFSR